ncbi:MAG TPA: ATP-binding protein [Nannocystis sp.]
MAIDRELEGRVRLARWALACITASGLALAVADAVAFAGHRHWQHLGSLVLDLAFVAVCLVARLRLRGDDVDPARPMQIGYVALLAVLVTTGCLVDEPLLFLGCFAAFAILATAPRIFPASRLDRWTYLAVVSALVLGVLELIPLPLRLPGPGPVEDVGLVVFVAALLAAGGRALRELPRYPLKIKLTLTTLLLALAPVAISRVDAHFRLAAIDADLALSDMSVRAASAAGEWDQLFARQLAPLRALGADGDALAACRGDTAARLQLERQLLGWVGDGALITSAGLWGSAGEHLVGVGAAFPTQAAPTAAVTFLPDADVFLLSAPVRDGDAASAGTLAVALRPGLVRAWSDETRAAGFDVVLRDRDDRVLFATDDALVSALPEYAALPPAPRPADAQLPGVPRDPGADAITARLDDDRLVGVARIAGPDWTLALVRSAPAAVAVAAAQERRTQWLTLLLAALASAGAFALSRRLAAPVARLAAAMARFGAGGAEATPPALDPADSHATDEIGELERRFDQMAEQAGALVRSLEQQTRRLQAEVAERSEQERRLQTLNRELSAATEQAQAANRAKSTFLAHMSHELRTPLTAIIGYGEMLQDHARETGQEDVARDAHNIVESAQHLLTIINEILDLSKIEAGKMDLVLEDFDAARLVQEVADVVRPMIAANRNRLVVEIEEDPAPMYSDRVKLRQALLNLLGNAAKFTQDGEVALGLKQRTAAGLICLVFTVRDTGPGIPESALATLFDPFTQVKHPGAVKKPTGTGLGLAITRRFCRLLGGEIGVTSTVGVGSTFTITLPVSYRGIRESSSWRPIRSPLKMDETARIRF